MLTLCGVITCMGKCVPAVCWDSMHGKVYVGVVCCYSIHEEVCVCCVFRGKAAVAMRCNPGRGCRATSDSLRASIQIILCLLCLQKLFTVASFCDSLCG